MIFQKSRFLPQSLILPHKEHNCFFLKQVLFIYLKGTINLLVHPLEGCNGQGWVRSKAGAWNSTQVSHINMGTQVLGSSYIVFPDALTGNWISSGLGVI